MCVIGRNTLAKKPFSLAPCSAGSVPPLSLQSHGATASKNILSMTLLGGCFLILVPVLLVRSRSHLRVSPSRQSSENLGTAKRLS